MARIIPDCLGAQRRIDRLDHRKVPDAPGRANDDRSSLRHVIATPGVVPILLVILTWMTAHNILYTYIAPFAMAAGCGSIWSSWHSAEQPHREVRVDN